MVAFDENASMHSLFLFFKTNMEALKETIKFSWPGLFLKCGTKPFYCIMSVKNEQPKSFLLQVDCTELLSDNSNIGR